MQIVIDIPEEIYERFGHEYSDENCISKYTNDIILNAFCNGILLPKGHGRLIDADKAVRKENSKMVDFETTNTRDRSYCRYVRNILDDAPTIIEAEEK